MTDKLREHILNTHANANKSHKTGKKRIKTESLEKSAKPQEKKREFEEINDHIFSDEKSLPSDEDIMSDSNKNPQKKRFQPKVPPTDYERFIYKCQHCQLGFKRRGKMLRIKSLPISILKRFFVIFFSRRNVGESYGETSS